MGRSAFAERFRALLGVAPLDYVTRWRMLTAAHQLRDTTRTVAAVGRDLGYRSEQAFGAAFRRLYGQAPAAYRSLFRRV